MCHSFFIGGICSFICGIVSSFRSFLVSVHVSISRFQ